MGNSLNRDELTGQRANPEPWTRAIGRELLGGIPEGDNREKGTESTYEEMMAENISNLGKETSIQVQEAQRISNKMNTKRPTPSNCN